MSTLEGSTFLNAGASWGISLENDGPAARDGANVAITAMTAEVNSRLLATVYGAAEEIEAAHGECLPLRIDTVNALWPRTVIQYAAPQMAIVRFALNDLSIKQPDATDLLPPECVAYVRVYIPLRQEEILFKHWLLLA